MLLTAAVAALLQAAPAQDTTGAYLDAAARELVAGARDRRARVERTIDAYSVTARHRIHAGVSALSRDRTLFGQEMAVRVDWRRDEPGTVRVLGAREASPATSRGVSLPGDLRTEATDLAFDPDRLQLNLFMLGGNPPPQAPDTSDGRDISVSTEIVDPLAAGAEAHYRYRAADTTTVRLPDGETLQLVRVEIIPRRREFRLLRGSLWIDTRTHGVVRSVFSTARPFELRRDADEDVPRIVDAMGIGADVRYVTVEYALWRGRFWLPRLVAIDAQANIGALAGMPVRFERSYSDYEVTASAVPQQAPVSALARVDTADARICRQEAEAAGQVCACEFGACRVWNVEVPADTLALLTSPDLPPPLADGAARLITGEEVEELARVLTPSLGSLGRYPPELRTRLFDARALRYNRVEGLSVGARADVLWGPLTLDARVRLGLAQMEPQAELGLARETLQRRTRLGAYRRLAAFDPSARPFGLGASLSALLFGRDEADYFLATGAELTGRPVRTGRWSYAWRLFGEHQHAVEKNTDVTLARSWDDTPFRPVRPADDADQAGAVLALTRDFGSDRTPVRLALGGEVEGQAGTYGFGRGQASARFTAPGVGRFALALEGAAGTSTGDVPVQGLWYLGGPSSVRGYEGALVGGTAFWRARAELGTALPAARLVVFSDAGWVGDRGAWELDPPLLSAGVGASFLDGLVRFDVSRALRAPTGWRVDLYLDAAL